MNRSTSFLSELLVAWAVACDGTTIETDPFGSGSPSLGLRYLSKDMYIAALGQTVAACSKCSVYDKYFVVTNSHVFKVRGGGEPRGFPDLR